jgi:signal transduction histidine kinase
MATEAALRFANQELEAFSYSVSHDLRTPLVTILGFSNLLGKHMAALGDPKAAHYLSRITEGVEHMGRLVDGLLALSHITRHKLDLKDVDLSKAAHRIVDLYRQQDPSRNVQAAVPPMRSY